MTFLLVKHWFHKLKTWTNFPMSPGVLDHRVTADYSHMPKPENSFFFVSPSVIVQTGFFSSAPCLLFQITFFDWLNAFFFWWNEGLGSLAWSFLFSWDYSRNILMLIGNRVFRVRNIKYGSIILILMEWVFLASTFLFRLENVVVLRLAHSFEKWYELSDLRQIKR